MEKMKDFKVERTKYGYYASATINDCKCGQAFRHKVSNAEAMQSLYVNYLH